MVYMYQMADTMKKKKRKIQIVVIFKKKV